MKVYYWKIEKENTLELLDKCYEEYSTMDFTDSHLTTLLNIFGHG